MNSLTHATKFLLITATLMFISASLQAKVLNRIVAVVDSGVILESDIETRIDNLKAQTEERGDIFETSTKLRDQVLEQLILEQAQIEIAKRKGLEVDDARVNETLAKIAKSRGTDLLGLKKIIESKQESFEVFRNQIYRELLLNMVRDLEVRSRIEISDSQLKRFLKTTGGQISTAPELLLSQIVVALPNQPSAKVVARAEQKILKIRDALLKGAPFGQIASRFSDAPEANRGGDLGWRNILELNQVFSNVLTNAKKNTLVGPIRSTGGFHLIAIRDRRGDQPVLVTEYKTRHILVKPDAVRSLDKAQQLADNIRRELLTGADFAELARRFSEDPISSAKGGNLGWIRPDQIVPGFAETMVSLPVNTISDVSKSRYGYHIIEVLDQRKADISEEQMKNRARRILVERKFNQELDSWLRQVRADAFVDIK